MINIFDCQTVRQKFHERGISVREWAITEGFNPTLVYQVLSGRLACTRGTSHRIAVKLGLKPLVAGELVFHVDTDALQIDQASLGSISAELCAK